MTPEELAEIEERARKATAGPWKAVNGHGAACVKTVDSRGRAIYINVRSGDSADVSDETVESWHADARFIAHARTDVPALCADNRSLRARAEKAEAEVARLTEALAAAARVVRRGHERAEGREETP